MKPMTVLFLLFMSYITPAMAFELTIYTEELPPYNYTQNGKIAGVSSEVVQHIMADTGYKFKIKSLTGRELYKRAQVEKNALIYSISRQKDRESLFKWIGVLTPRTYSLAARGSRKKMKTKTLTEQFERIKNMKTYGIGANADDVVQSWLPWKGYALSDFAHTAGSDSAAKNFRSLLNGEIDLWPVPDAVAYYIVREQGYSNPSTVMWPVFILNELSGDYYIAGSRNTSDSVIADVRRSLTAFKKTDTYYKILGRWGVNTAGLKTSEPIKKLVYAFKHLRMIKKIGYLASDNLTAHIEVGLYRKEMREAFVERYARTTREWKRKFMDFQENVDAIILGDISGIKDWNETDIRAFLSRNTHVPTGYVLEGMSDYTMIGYEEDKLILNNKIAAVAGFNFSRGMLKKADKVIN